MEAEKYDDSLMDIVTDIAMKTNAIVEYICIPENEFSEKSHGMHILEISKVKED